MAISFPTEAEEWVQAYRDQLNQSEEYAEEGAEWGVDFDGSFLFEIQPDDTYDGDPVRLYLDLEDGTCLDASVVDEEGAVEPGFALRASYSAWKDLIQGKLNPIEAILSGPFDLEGDRVKVMQWSGAGIVMTELAASVDTEFEY
ncbi:MAG: SCP2 sterol-binding domain-containing protein [Halodesulfurarchaeum sp.]